MIELPSNRKVTGVTVYAVDGSGAIVGGCIGNIQVKNADRNIIAMPFDVINDKNRSDGVVRLQSDSKFNNVAFIDFSQGELAQAIDTNITNDKDTALYIDLDENGVTDPKIRCVFETITAS